MAANYTSHSSLLHAYTIGLCRSRPGNAVIHRPSISIIYPSPPAQYGRAHPLREFSRNAKPPPGVGPEAPLPCTSSPACYLHLLPSVNNPRGKALLLAAAGTVKPWRLFCPGCWTLATLRPSGSRTVILRSGRLALLRRWAPPLQVVLELLQDALTQPGINARHRVWVDVHGNQSDRQILLEGWRKPAAPDARADALQFSWQNLLRRRATMLLEVLNHAHQAGWVTV
eukprot:scaffold11_cov257-Pinguiococcus_pyrenoidosus.AAC.40